MTPEYATVSGVLKPDGTLELTQPLRLPPGPVEVTVKTVMQDRRDTMTVMQEIWAAQQADNRPRRTKEEIDAYVAELRNELEEHIVAAEELQQACRQAREKPAC